MIDHLEEEEIITEDNDPEKIIIVPEDDYVTHDNETKIEYDEVISSPIVKSTEKSLYEYDLKKFHTIFHALKNGEFR